MRAMTTTAPKPADLRAIVGGATLDELVAEAGRRRDAAHGNHVTFSPKVFVPLTMLCRDRCGYCTFAKPPARLEAPFLTPEQVLAIARRGAAAGCHEVLFTLGEAPEARYPQAQAWLAEHGYASTVDYLVAMCELVVDRDRAAPPRQRRRARRSDELERLRRWSPSQGMMIETLAARLGEPGGPHHGAPDKTPERRLATLEAAGLARVPFTTGILVGIGETRAERLEALARDRRESRTPRSRAGSDRPELPAEAGHRDAQGRRRAPPTSTSGRSPRRASCCRRRSTSRRRRTSATTSRRSSPRASTTGAASRPSPSIT